MKKAIIILSIFFCAANIAAQYVTQKITPSKSAVIDTVTRAQCKQIVKEIRTMRLKCDTLLFDKKDDRYKFAGIYFDRKGRLRKYFRKEPSPGDGSGESLTMSAYYNEDGELVYLYLDTGDTCDGDEEFYYIDKGRIVDFTDNWESICGDGKKMTQKEINHIRPVIGNPLKVSMSGWGIKLTNFIQAKTLLKILKSKEYPDRGELF